MPSHLNLKISLLLAAVILSLSPPLPRFARADNLTATLLSRREVALKSIRSQDAKKHIDALASDPFEGREAGTRGGRAAAVYLGQEFAKLKLQGINGGKTYVQEFGNNMQNLIGILPGRDETLRNEYIILSAHYDHVGYGDARNSLGPIGHIHNGADDNASGVSSLLEIADAFAALEMAPRRSIIFALWDGEEKELLGSRHWISSPTVPLRQLKFAVNIDMVGRLQKNQHVEIGGVRTAPGLREIVSRHNQDSGLKADFPWEIPDNSDHYPFYEQGIPFIYPFTGFHDDYHRPSDDADRIDNRGVERISQWMFSFLLDFAETDQIPGYRAASRNEGEGQQQAFEQVAEHSDEGLGWKEDEAEPTTILVVNLQPGSRMHATGLLPKDRIYAVSDQRFKTSVKFQELLKNQAEAGTLLIERDGRYYLLKLRARSKPAGAPATTQKSTGPRE